MTAIEASVGEKTLVIVVDVEAGFDGTATGLCRASAECNHGMDCLGILLILLSMTSPLPFVIMWL